MSATLEATKDETTSRFAEFKDLQRDVGEQLSYNDVNTIEFYFNLQPTQPARSGLTLLHLLHKQGRFSPWNTQPLRDLLRKVDRCDLADDRVKRFQLCFEDQESPQTPHRSAIRCSSLPPESSPRLLPARRPRTADPANSPRIPPCSRHVRAGSELSEILSRESLPDGESANGSFNYLPQSDPGGKSIPQEEPPKTLTELHQSPRDGYSALVHFPCHKRTGGYYTHPISQPLPAQGVYSNPWSTSRQSLDQEGGGTASWTPSPTHPSALEIASADKTALGVRALDTIRHVMDVVGGGSQGSQGGSLSSLHNGQLRSVSKTSLPIRSRCSSNDHVHASQSENYTPTSPRRSSYNRAIQQPIRSSHANNVKENNNGKAASFPRTDGKEWMLGSAEDMHKLGLDEEIRQNFESLQVQVEERRNSGRLTPKCNVDAGAAAAGAQGGVTNYNASRKRETEDEESNLTSPGESQLQQKIIGTEGRDKYKRSSTRNPLRKFLRPLSGKPKTQQSPITKSRSKSRHISTHLWKVRRDDMVKHIYKHSDFKQKDILCPHNLEIDCVSLKTCPKLSLKVFPYGLFEDEKHSVTLQVKIITKKDLLIPPSLKVKLNVTILDDTRMTLREHSTEQNLNMNCFYVFDLLTHDEVMKTLQGDHIEILFSVQTVTPPT